MKQMSDMSIFLWSIPIFAFVAFAFWFLMPEAEAKDVHYVSQLPDVHLDLYRLRSVIRAVENTPHNFISPSGARSCYQLKEATWRQHSGRAFTMASLDTPEAKAEIERVALKHIAWLVREIGKRRYTVSAAEVGQAWKAGLTAWLEHRITFEDAQFGVHCANIYGETAP